MVVLVVCWYTGVMVYWFIGEHTFKLATADLPSNRYTDKTTFSP